MTEQRDEEFQLPEPPEGLLKYPANRVRALMDDPDEVVAAIDDLVQAGFDRKGIFGLAGPEGAERIDLTGRHHGLRGRLYRFMAHLGGEYEYLRAASEHLAGGGLYISVPADDEKKAVAAQILKTNGGHDVIHYGKGHFESLG